jgi:hypothetical protein
VFDVRARHPGVLAADRHDQHGERDEGDHQGHGVAHRHIPERDAGGEPAERHQQVGATQQPAVAEADLTTPRGEPEEEQTADGPLQEDRGGIEADHDVNPHELRVARRSNTEVRLTRCRCNLTTADRVRQRRRTLHRLLTSVRAPCRSDPPP